MQSYAFVHNEHFSNTFFTTRINEIYNIRKQREKQSLLQQNHSYVAQMTLHLLLFLDPLSCVFQCLQRTRNSGSTLLSLFGIVPMQVDIWQGTFIISLRDCKENICLPHTKPISVPCLNRESVKIDNLSN